ncbi:DUF3885 domain-containing protein [Salipiger marinus]|uniref:DUF3885 domain-containing protein n=1 Tax=Salipiger marinus TaxID=555512 RepID=UPI004059557E
MSLVVCPPPSAEFAHAWRRVFGEVPPLGHILRREFFCHWARFHALPDSKRYADTQDEWFAVLSRANTLATECFGEHAQVWVATGKITELPTESKDLPVRMGMTEAMTWIDYREEPVDQSKITFFAVEYDWKPKSLDGLFGEIANDEGRAILFSEDARTVLAPYDGGFDIISFQPGKIQQLENTYRAWMSSGPDKL